VGILWLAGSASLDLGVGAPSRYRPRHAVPPLPMRLLRTSQTGVQGIVVGGLTIASGRRRARSSSMPSARLRWDHQSAAAERLMSATELTVADSGPPTLPLPRVA
jgi:hypothetical protein